MFLLRLQVEFKIPSRKALLAQLDNDDINRWLCYEKEHPFANPWLQTAVECRAVFNSQGAKADLHQFMPVAPKIEKYFSTPEDDERMKGEFDRIRKEQERRGMV